MSIRLSPVETPTEKLTPIPPKAAATLAAPAYASIFEASMAWISTLLANTPRSALAAEARLSPSTKAAMSVAILLTPDAPAPLSETPTDPPLSATEPAATIAFIDALSVAVTEKSPAVLIPESAV